jgi:predicted ATP-binding protein involved in virulence
MPFYISKLSLENIRCFENLELEFSKNGKPITWTTLFGENSAGKTTLLRCIAIGLCDESSGAGLLRESEQGYIRRKKNRGVICITLRDFSNPTNVITIETIIKRKNTKKDTIENLRQNIIPERPNLWNEIFVWG